MKKSSVLKMFVIGMITGMVTGCGPKGEQIMIQNARGADYSTGYGDGCASGRYAAGNTEISHRRDTMRYHRSEQYRLGWETGFKECKFRERKIRKRIEKMERANGFEPSTLTLAR